MILREATLADTDLIGDLGQRIWWEHYPSIISEAQIAYMLERMYAPQALAWQMQAKSQRFFLAYIDGLPVGFAAFSIRTDGKSTYVFCNKLYGLATYRGRGVGRDLLNVGWDMAQTHGISAIRLFVNRRNSTVIWYERQGFRPIWEVDTPFGPYVMDDYLMEATNTPLSKKSASSK